MRRLRLIAGATAMAIVMVVAVPAALAAYTGTYTPTQSIAPHALSALTSFSCSASGSTVTITWSDPDYNVADPYGAFVIDGYVIESSTNGGAFTSILTPARTAVSATPTINFGLLALGNTIVYRMRATRSTNWVSATTATVTATITSILIIHTVTCA